MFGTMFGAEMPLAVRFLVAFLVVLGLIGITAWAVRRFGTGRLGGGSTRGRQPRLAVIDYASVDARRQLVLVRRDNVEHLLMIGGPTDVVVEANIVRAAPAVREAAAPRPPAAAEALPRTVPLPLPESAANGSWPLQPEQSGAPRPVPRLEPITDEPAGRSSPLPAETAARPAREALTALADEIAVRAAPPRHRTTTATRIQPPEARAPAARPVEAEAAAAASDQNLADMAQRLEAALRKPRTTAEGRDARAPAPAPRAALQPEEDEEEAVAPPPPRAARPVEAKLSQTKTLYDSLEQEMASLLGRPPGKI